MSKHKLVIIGDSAFAEVAYEYFTHDSEYEVVGFAVEQAYITRNELFGIPVFPFEEMAERYSTVEVSFFAALVYTQLNRLRTRLYKSAKAMGFEPASYISSKSFIWRNVKLGEHCFIMEDNTLQPFVTIGNNVVLWSGNHIGHHSSIGDNAFISSHVVISGFCNIGKNCFLGVNSALGNNVNLGRDNWLGPSVSILSDTEAGKVYRVEQPPAAKASAFRLFKVSE